MAIGTRRNSRALTPVPTSPDPLAATPASPAPSPSIALSDLAGMAENTTPNASTVPRLGHVIRPSDEREDAEAFALLSPVRLSRGRVRNCSASSLGSPAPSAPKNIPVPCTLNSTVSSLPLLCLPPLPFHRRPLRVLPCAFPPPTPGTRVINCLSDSKSIVCRYM